MSHTPSGWQRSVPSRSGRRAAREPTPVQTTPLHQSPYKRSQDQPPPSTGRRSASGEFGFDVVQARMEQLQTQIAASREVFFETWKTCKGDGAFWRNGKSSGVFFWRMLPWWVFSHALQLPRKYCQFLPPLIIEHLLRFLDNPVSNPHLILIVLIILT